jgi:hypothetical protein
VFYLSYKLTECNFTPDELSGLSIIIQQGTDKNPLVIKGGLVDKFNLI